MKNFTRRSEEITATPERTISSRVQGKMKLGRGSSNPFEPLQTEEDEEEEQEDDTTMKEATEENAVDKITASEALSLSKDNTKYGETEVFMGRKMDGSSILPSPSVLAKTAGTPGSVSFANSTGENETGLNKLRPTAKEKIGEITKSDIPIPAKITDHFSKSKGEKKSGGKSTKSGTPSTTTSTSRTSSSYSAAARKEAINQDQELQGVTAVVTIIVKVVKGDDPKKKFTDKIIEGLKFLHETGEDKEVSVLLINHEGGVTNNTKRIKKKADVPTSIMGLRKFISVSSEVAFNKVNNASGRSIKCSARLFFSSDPKKLLAEAGADLRSLGVGIFYKDLQEVETEDDNVLLGAPMTMDTNQLQKQLEQLLMDTEKGPDFKGAWSLPIKVAINFAPGMPFESEEEKKRSKIPPLAKQVYQITVAKENSGRLDYLLRELKGTKKLHELYGPTAFTVKVPTYEQATEKMRYLQMMGTHAAVHMSTGTAPLPGIIDLNTKYNFERLPSADGPREDVKLSLCEVIMLLTTNEGGTKKNLFTTVVQGSPGTVLGIFASVNPEVNETITKISHIMGPQVYYKLLRMGCKTKDIKRFIRKVFTADQVSNVSHSKYDKKTGRAQVREAQVEDIISAALLLGIDTSLGLTQAQLKERKEALEYDARAITFGEAKDGDLFAIDANEEQSVNTVHTMRSQATSIAEKTTGNTVFSIGTDFDYNSEDDDGSEDEKNSPRGQILFEGLDLLNHTKEKGNERNEESSEEQSKKTAKEDLEYKMERAQRENEMIDSENEEYQDARESDEDIDDEEWEGTGANNQEELQEEATLLEWENKLDKVERGKERRKYRIVKADNVQGQIFNEAGPHLKDMEWMSERVMAEVVSIYKGNIRDVTKLSDTMLRLLKEEVEDPDNTKPSPDYEKMYSRMNELRSNYALLHREETLATHKARNEMMEEDDKEHAEAGPENLNEDEEMKCASGGTTANRSGEENTKDKGSIQDSNDEVKSEDDESEGADDEEEWKDSNDDDDDDEEEEDEEDVEFAASKRREENVGKRLPSALRSKKVGPIQSFSKVSNETEDTGQEPQARKTQGEVTLTESRAEND